ncbi:MAG: hypothetical protein Q8L07_07455 [Sediminibacterium sp.]|nr:hypothetical protein [Sediminibacterium sp.]
MKKIILLSLTGILFILVSFFSCNKENTELTQTTVVKPNPDSCATVSSKGRIIGFDYCYNFMSAQKVMGAGFIIEIDNGATRDTALTYGIPDSLFQFLPSDRVDGMFPYLFKPEVQDKFKIKFNYTFTSNNAFHNYDCNVPANIQLPPLFSFRRKEILITCISPL